MTPSRRVIAVHPNSDLYGSDRMFLSTLDALHGRGDIELLSLLPEEGRLSTAIRDHGIALRVDPFPVLRRVEMHGRGLVLFPARLTAALPRLVLFLRRHKADTVYVNTVVCPIWLLAGRLAGCRVVAHVHENEPDMSARTRRILLSQLRLATLVVANSAATKDWVESVIGTKPATRVVYNGIAAPGASPTPPSPSSHSGATRLLVLGRLSQRKGQDVAIAAVAILAERGIDVSLTLVGDHYPGYEAYVEELEALITRHGLEASVRLAGFTADPSGYIAEAEVFIVPSRVEPFGNVAVEGLMSGTPTVVSDVDGLCEIVTDGKTGLTVRPDDPGALADAIARVIADPTAAAAMASAGREEAARRFGMARYDKEMGVAVLGDPAV
jgi:glycosyltransferase involved in cell wall biosynthesis